MTWPRTHSAGDGKIQSNGGCQVRVRAAPAYTQVLIRPNPASITTDWTTIAIMPLVAPVNTVASVTYWHPYHKAPLRNVRHQQYTRRADLRSVVGFRRGRAHRNDETKALWNRGSHQTNDGQRQRRDKTTPSRKRAKISSQEAIELRNTQWPMIHWSGKDTTA